MNLNVKMSQWLKPLFSDGSGGGGGHAKIPDPYMVGGWWKLSLSE